MTPALIFFVVSGLLGAVALDSYLWRRFATDPPGPWERAASISVITLFVLIAINWSLSWLGLLDRVPLLVAAAILAVPSAVFLARSNALAFARTDVREASTLLFLSPLLVWIVFVLWRGAVVPVLSHDALSYHMPKAVMLARAHHYAFFNAPDPRIPTSPANYEMLLADVLLLAKTDAVTEWIGTVAYIALILLGAALVERWWGKAPHIAATVLVVAAVPVILLHSGAHKNDLLSNVFYLGALVWGGRWIAGRETAPLVLSLASLAAAGGTKIQGAFVAVALLVVFAGHFLRGRVRVTRGQLLVIFASIPVALFLFGGWAYVLNVVHTGQVALPASSTSDAGYGDWRNLWEVPLFILLRPFDLDPRAIYVPWRGERWFWPRFELYFSHYGTLVTALVLFLPLAIWKSRHRFGSAAMQRERLITSIAAALAFLLMLPIRIRPIGFFGGFPRYFCYIAIIVIAWTVAPLVLDLHSRSKTTLVKVALATAAFLFSVNAIFYAIVDAFQPLSYVADVAADPGIRRPFFAPYRAGSVVDLVAGPTDTIAVHSGFDSWIYPAYGKTLQREVFFIEPGQPIPKEADYVIVDRAWNVIWGHPRFENMSQYKEYLSRGTPSDEDLAVIRAVGTRSDEFELIYFNGTMTQAIFKRRPAR